MEKNDLVTVVVPIYNMAKYLSKCIDALLVQTYTNYEIILVDDGSTDESSELCDNYSNIYSKIRTIHKPNGGLSSARNAGIENANGQFIIFPDPDDWVEPDYLKKLMNLYQKNRTDLEICGYYITYEREEFIHNSKGSKGVLSTEKALSLLMTPSAYCGFAWNKLYHMDIIVNNNLRFDTELGMAQDLHFAYRYIVNCDKVSYDPKPMYHYNQGSGGVTNIRTPLNKRKITGLMTYEKIAELAHEKHFEVEQLAKSTIFNMSMHFLFIYYSSKMNDEKIYKMLHCNLYRYRKYFFKNNIYSLSHKMLGVLAIISPKLYYFTKKIFSKEV